MFRSTLLPLAAAGLWAACLAGPASAATSYSLAGDFSAAGNPNGVWSFTQGATLLGSFMPSTANPINAALTGGYWGTGSDLNTATPWVGQASVNGSAAAPYTDGDFLAGDVLVHSTNPGTGGSVFLHWTAPSAGSIDFSVSAWYAHSPVIRAGEVLVHLDGTTLDSGTFDNASGRSNALNFLGTALAVGEGTVFSVELRAAAGQSFGSIAGLSETILFTPSAPVPEPGSLGLLLAGLGVVGTLARRRGA